MDYKPVPATPPPPPGDTTPTTISAETNVPTVSDRERPYSPDELAFTGSLPLDALVVTGSVAVAVGLAVLRQRRRFARG